MRPNDRRTLFSPPFFTELKPTNVARASLEALRLDYEDFLRQRGWTAWTREDPRRTRLIARRCATVEVVAAWVEEIHGQHGRSGRHGQSGGLGGTQQLSSTPPGSSSSTSSISSTYPEIAAKAALVLIAVAASLLDRQLAAQARAFEEEGGFTERLYRTRVERRQSRR
jgi:four helix bundle suffix protein